MQGLGHTTVDHSPDSVHYASPSFYMERMGDQRHWAGDFHIQGSDRRLPEAVANPGTDPGLGFDPVASAEAFLAEAEFFSVFVPVFDVQGPPHCVETSEPLFSGVGALAGGGTS